MKRGAGPLPLWALLLAVAGPGCTHCGKPPAPPMPPKAGVSADYSPLLPPDWNDEIHLKLAPSQILAPSPTRTEESAVQPEPALKEGFPRLRLRLDQEAIRAMQMKEIEEQREEDEADIHPRNGFTRWLDGFHERMYCRMDNAVRKVDTMWLTDDDRAL